MLFCLDYIADISLWLNVRCVLFCFVNIADISLCLEVRCLVSFV